MRINDRLRPFSPTEDAFRRRSMRVKWLLRKGLLEKFHEPDKVRPLHNVLVMQRSQGISR